jgi:hypothetical protein
MKVNPQKINIIAISFSFLHKNNRPVKSCSEACKFVDVHEVDPMKRLVQLIK